ncbi:MAG: hypothetical protein JW700_00080 [Candidatus Aenigmarchaeota archaeon]|nr:hypothetical protein [Candidatus Aenigmarchaeota archaeon]
MKFEEFERTIRENGFGIAAMNHYSINGKDYTYCVVLNSKKGVAFKGEAQTSEEAFDIIIEKIKQNIQ